MAAALPWSIAIQLPAIIVGWVVGNILGALAAFKGGGFDRGAFVSTLFLSSMPYFCLAILLQFIVGVQLGILPGEWGVLLRFDTGTLGGLLG